MFDKIKAWCKRSLTIAWARILQFAGIALLGLNQLADFAQAVGFGQYIPGKWAAVYTLVIGVITELARRRSLGKAA